MPFFLYQLYWKRVLGIKNKWYPTDITFKARNENEAMKKARKFWEEGQFGMGSIMVSKIKEV